MLCVCGVLSEIRNQVSPAHVQHRAGRNDRAESDICLKTPIQNRRQQGSTLAEKRHIPRLRDVPCEGRVEPQTRIHHPEAVRSDEAHLAPAKFRSNLALEFRSFGTSFFEPGGDNDSRSRPRINALADHTRNRRRRRHDRRQGPLFREPPRCSRNNEGRGSPIAWD